MYFNLALRNAKRSIFNYLLYITTTTIILFCMLFSNYVALIAKVEAGFQSMALPVLLSFILIILVSYINNFILKQRAKEFANYLLLGMEKKNLVNMFLYEFGILGCLCYIGSCLIGFVLCNILSNYFIGIGSSGFHFIFYLQSAIYTFLYFCVIEAFSMYTLKRRIYTLEIIELMVENKRSQKFVDKDRHRVWSIILFITILILLLLLCSFLCLPNNILLKLLSLAFLPLSLAIVSFYKWLYNHLSLKRDKLPNMLFQKERLYLIAKMTCAKNSNATLNAIFCLCLFLSSISFGFGTFMLQSDGLIFNSNIQIWMGFLQIILCIIFIVIYFSIISIRQMIELQQQKEEFQILHYLGKSMGQLKHLLIKQIFINLLLPTVLCFLLLGIFLPFLNYKLNTLLPVAFSNFCFTTFVSFFICFLVLYTLYFFIVYRSSKHILSFSITK